MHQLKYFLHTCERTCFSTPGACSYHSYRRASCCNSHSLETSCRCGPVQSSCTEKTLVSTLLVHAVNTATARFPVAIVTVGNLLQRWARPIILHRENTCFYTPGACSYRSYHTVSCCNSPSWETSCRCGPGKSS